MSDWTSLIQNAVAGLITGGAGATSTILAVFKDIKKRLDNLEKTVGSAGSSVEARTGLFLLIGQLTETLDKANEEIRKLRRGFDNLEDDPPDWFTRAMNRRPSFVPDHTQDYERIEKIAKSALDRAKQVEGEVEEMRKDVDRLSRDFVSQDSFDHDSAKRLEDIRKLQENLSTVNGFLRGVMATLGYIDAPPQPPPQPQPTTPQLPPRRK